MRQITTKRKLRKSRVAMLVVGLAAAPVLVIVLVLRVMNWGMADRVEERLEALRAEGAPATLNELDDWYAFPTNETNASDIYLRAFEEYTEFWDLYGGRFPWVRVPVQPGRGRLPHRTEPIPEQMEETVAQLLTLLDQYLASVKEASEHSAFRHPINISSGQRREMTELSKFYRAVQFLMLKAMLSSEQRHFDVEALEVLYDVGDAMGNEPFVRSHLMRIACYGLGSRALQRMLNRTSAPEESLLRLSQVFAQAQDVEIFRRGIIGERVTVEDGIRSLSLSSWNDWIAQIKDGEYLAAARRGMTPFYLLAGGQHRETLAFFDGVESTLSEVTALSEGKPVDLDALNDVEENFSVAAEAVTLKLPVLVRLYAKHLALCRTAQTALALERYRLKYSTMPLCLDALVPEFLDAVPVDPVDGEALRYRPLPEGYVVYSIGLNREDEDGAESATTDSGWADGDLTFTVERSIHRSFEPLLARAN